MADLDPAVLITGEIQSYLPSAEPSRTRYRGASGFAEMVRPVVKRS